VTGRVNAPRLAQIVTALVALTITDRTCKALTGFDARPWKVALVALKVPHFKVGHRTVCRADDWLAAVSRATGADAATPRPAPSADDFVERAAGKGARR
jgi:hypothetical protein